MPREHKTSPNISVIIPSFQNTDELLQCLAALQNQSMNTTQFEVIVVDNGSTPPIKREDIEQAELSVSLVKCDTPGAYAARNCGVLAAVGEYLAFTDADCIPDKLWLENGIRALKSNIDDDFIIGGEVLFTQSEDPSATELYQTIVGFQQAQNIYRKGFTVTANLLCSRRAFERIGPFNESLFSGGDAEWCWRAKNLGFEVRHQSDAVVLTKPRMSLGGAIRQARRVAGGRLQLKQLGLHGQSKKNLAPHRGALASLLWILDYRALSLRDRLRVLVVAVLIKLATILEVVRLKFGSERERR